MAPRLPTPSPSCPPSIDSICDITAVKKLPQNQWHSNYIITRLSTLRVTIVVHSAEPIASVTGCQL